MADVNSERGQLFMVTALTLAVLLVALALLLNTAIYTENLATRSEEGDVRAAREFRVAATDDVADLVRSVNYRNNTTYADLDGALTGGVDDWSAAAGIHGASAGRGVNASLHGTVEGTRIVQADARPFEDVVGSGNWTLATDVHGRDLYLNVAQPSLGDGSALGSDPADHAQSGLFRVVHADGATTWSTYVYRDGAGNAVVRTLVDDGSKSLLPACTRAPVSGSVSLDFERGLAGGSPCPSLAFEPGPSYDLRYRNATDGGGAPNVEGTYEVVVDESKPTYDGGTGSVSALVGTDPYSTPAVYAARVTVAFETGRVSYRTTVRANPANVDRRYGVAGTGRPAATGGGAGDGGGAGGGGGSGDFAPNATVEMDASTAVGGNEYDVTVSYAVDDGNDDMTSVELVLKDPDGNVEDVIRVSPGASPDSGSETFTGVKINGKDENGDWTVEVTVFDDDGLTGTDSDTEALP